MTTTTVTVGTVLDADQFFNWVYLNPGSKISLSDTPGEIFSVGSTVNARQNNPVIAIFDAQNVHWSLRKADNLNVAIMIVALPQRGSDGFPILS